MLHSITWSGNILYLLFLPLSTSKHGCTTVIHKLRILVAQDQFHFVIMTPVLCEMMVLMCSWNRECMEILFQALSAQTLREAALYRRNSLMEVKAVASMMGPHNLDSIRKAQIFLEDNRLFFADNQHDSLGLRFSTIQPPWEAPLI